MFEKSTRIMNKESIPLELAVKLKEKGFNEPCYGYYHCNGGNDSFELCGNGDCDFLNSKNKHRVAAPTISQVLKWLREEKNIHICIDIYDDGWFFDIASFYKEDTGVYEIKLPYKSSKVTPDYDSFEQATLAGIEYVLDNLI